LTYSLKAPNNVTHIWQDVYNKFVTDASQRSISLSSQDGEKDATKRAATMQQIAHRELKAAPL
jgi:hypothetical protein